MTEIKNPSTPREIRELKFKLKHAHKQIGRQGQMIHLLRAEMAELRELHSKIERDQLRCLENRIRDRDRQIVMLREKVQGNIYAHVAPRIEQCH